MSLIEELEAKTVVQVYLAEKIFECLWWIRRYDQQKRATIAREMGSLFDKSFNYSLTMSTAEVNNMQIVLDPSRKKEFQKLLKESGYTEQSLMQEALSEKALQIAHIDNQITVLAKNLAGFQASYEVLVNRKLNIERLRLQNELLSKDLESIEL